MVELNIYSSRNKAFGNDTLMIIIKLVLGRLSLVLGVHLPRVAHVVNEQGTSK